MRRLSGAAVLGGLALLGAVAFGSRPLGVAGIGLVLAAAAVRAWRGLAVGPVRCDHVVEPSPATEGDEVRVQIHVRRSSSLPVGSLLLRERLGRLGVVECRLRGHGRAAAGEFRLGQVPRGRYSVTDVELEIGDPLGLESISVPLAADGVVLVQPRLVELKTLFNDVGRWGSDGRRHLLRRPSGFDFHSVREHEEGESLRRVHWPTTARRGRLMVKELEETPRDAVVVLLDCDPAGCAGEPPDWSFDAAARAGGSVLRSYAARGRKATLVTTGRNGAVVHVARLAGGFQAALVALAAAEPDAPRALGQILGDVEHPAARAGELVVVTHLLETPGVERLLETAGGRRLAVVWIDAPSFAGRPTRVAPGALRLSSAGVPVAIVRRGDDLAAALGAPTWSKAAVG